MFRMSRMKKKEHTHSVGARLIESTKVPSLDPCASVLGPQIGKVTTSGPPVRTSSATVTREWVQQHGDTNFSN